MIRYLKTFTAIVIGLAAVAPAQEATKEQPDESFLLNAMSLMADEGPTPAQRSRAVSNLVRIASTGHVAACAFVGHAYDEGIGVEQDYVTAVAWFERGTILGDELSRSSLGKALYEGKGVPQDYARAWEVLLPLTTNSVGPGPTWYLLGEMSAGGHGVKTNNLDAYVWYYLAAMGGWEEYVAARDNAASKLSHDEVSRGKARAAHIHQQWEANKADRIRKSSQAPTKPLTPTK